MVCISVRGQPLRSTDKALLLNTKSDVVLHGEERGHLLFLVHSRGRGWQLVVSSRLCLPAVIMLMVVHIKKTACGLMRCGVFRAEMGELSEV